VRDIQSELQNVGLKILPPDILKSSEDFVMAENGFRMGLSAVKGLSGAALEKIKSFKAVVDSRFTLYLSLQNSKIPLNVITSLFLAGAFDSVKGDISRNALLMHYEIWNELTPRELPIINNLGPKFNYDIIEILKRASTDLKDEKGRPIIKESRLNTLRTKTKPYILKYKHNEKFSDLSAYIAENHYLGFSYSHSLKSIYSKHIHDLTDLKQLSSAPAGDYKVVAQLVESEERVSKTSKKTYVKYDIKDDVGSLSCLSFSLDSREAMIQNNGRMIKSGDIAVWHLTKKCKDQSGQSGSGQSDSIHFVQDIVIQDVPTVLKVSEIRKEMEKESEKT